MAVLAVLAVLALLTVLAILPTLLSLAELASHTERKQPPPPGLVARRWAAPCPFRRCFPCGEPVRKRGTAAPEDCSVMVERSHQQDLCFISGGWALKMDVGEPVRGDKCGWGLLLGLKHAMGPEGKGSVWNDWLRFMPKAVL